MKRFLRWRKMTWAILAGSAAMSVWIIGGGPFVFVVALWAVGLVVLTTLWFMSRPLWRQGHGVRLRRLRSPGTEPVQSFDRLSTGR
jgi:hypothetical protein